MRIPLIINNESLYIECESDEILLPLLRNLNLISVKCGCTKGFCGACTVLIEGKPVPSCLIPIATARGRSIVTLEFFSTTEKYTDIIKGFEHVGLTLCGFCNAGKIFATNKIIETEQRPDRSTILQHIKTFNCMCTHDDLLVSGIIAASDIRRDRLWSLKYALR